MITPRKREDDDDDDASAGTSASSTWESTKFSEGGRRKKKEDLLACLLPFLSGLCCAASLFAAEFLDLLKWCVVLCGCWLLAREFRQFRKEQQEYAKAAAAQSGDTEFHQFRKEQQEYAKVAASQTTKLVEMVEGLAERQEKEGLKQKSRWKTLACWFVLWCAAVLLARQEYAKAAAAQTTKLVEMMEGLEKWKEGLKQPKNNQETLNDLVVQSTENPKDEGQEETEESDWVKFFFEKRFEWKFNDWVHEKKVRKDFFKYIMEKMEEVVERHRLQQRESAVLQKQGTLDEYWFLAKGLWRMKFEELGKLHKHYDEKRRAVRDKFESTKWYGHEQVQATLKKQFEDSRKKLNTSTRIFKLRLILRRSTCRSDIRAVRLSCSTSSST